MSEQTTPKTTEATLAPWPRERAKLLEGLNPFFYNSGVDEPYPELAMIQALTSVLINSEDSEMGKHTGRSFTVDDDDIGWLLLLIMNLARKIEKDVDAVYKDTRATWDELERRAINLEAQLAVLGGRPSGRTVEAQR